MTRFLILAFFVSVQGLMFGQEVFQRSYGGLGGEYGRAVIECSTGGYAIVGSTNSYQNAGTDIYLLRVDEVGDYIWGKSIGEANKTTWGIDLAEDDEGNFIIAGYTDNSPSGTYDGLLVKTNSVGEVIWQKSFGGDDWDFIENMVLTDNGEIILAGQTTVDGHQQGWIIKTDNAGEIIWEKLLESSGQLKITGLDVCENSSIVFTGYTSNYLLDTKTFVAGKYTNDGSMVWVSSYPEFGKIETGKCVCTASNDIVGIGSQVDDPSLTQTLLASINSVTGALNWTRAFNEPNSNIGLGIDVNSIGHILIAGAMKDIITPDFSAISFEFLETGQDISPDYAVLQGSTGEDIFYDITSVSDGGYICVGHTTSFGNNYQILLCKIGPHGERDLTNTDFIDLATSILSASSQPEFRIYPNPAIDKVYPEFDFSKNTIYRIYTVTGKEVGTGVFESSTEAEIDITLLESGMYILSFYENKIRIGSTRFIKLP